MMGISARRDILVETIEEQDEIIVNACVGI